MTIYFHRYNKKKRNCFQIKSFIDTFTIKNYVFLLLNSLVLNKKKKKLIKVKKKLICMKISQFYITDKYLIEFFHQLLINTHSLFH